MIHSASLAAIHSLSIGNRARLARSATAGCFSCETMFPASDIRTWIDASRTAVCPHCGTDSVLPSMGVMLTPDLLARLSKFYFD